MDHLLENKNQTNYYEHVYKNSMKFDIDIVVKGKVIKAHKEVLASQNTIFLDEFLSQPNLERIEIVDLDPEAVEIFIRYLYTGKIADGTISEELFLVAHRYVDPNLKHICRKELGQRLTLKNATGRFLAFLKCKEKNLINEGSIFLAKNFNDAKIYSDFDKVFENEEATDVIFESFGSCKITILSEDKNPDRKKLIDSARKSDLTIKVQDEHFLGHKQILSTRNTVFETVIAALPKTTNLSSSIDIPDFDSSTFKIFLNFIYTKDVDKQNISKELMNVANKYVDTKLHKICEDHFVSLICEENAVELLILSTIVMSENLKDQTSKFIAGKYTEMKNRADFQQVKEHPAAVEAIFNHFELRINSLYDSMKNQKNSNFFEGTFTLEIPSSTDEIYSESFYIRNVPWKIYVDLRDDNATQIGIHLSCQDQNVPFEHKVRTSFKLISSVSEEYDILRKTSVNAHKPYFSWGFNEFVSLIDLKDSKKGLMTNGLIKVKIDAEFIE